MKNLSYDRVDVFAPVGRVGSTPFVLASAPSVSVTSVAELISQAQRSPGWFSYESSNSGSIVSVALLSQARRIDLRHVPYKSSPQAISDVVAGHVDLLFVGPLAAGLQIAAGKLKLLGVTSASWLSQLPGVPSLVPELGGASLVAWYALFAPKGTPSTVVDRLNAKLLKFIGNQKVSDRLNHLGVTPWPSDPQTLKAFVGAKSGTGAA